MSLDFDAMLLCGLSCQSYWKQIFLPWLSLTKGKVFHVCNVLNVH